MISHDRDQKICYASSCVCVEPEWEKWGNGEGFWPGHKQENPIFKAILAKKGYLRPNFSKFFEKSANVF